MRTALLVLAFCLLTAFTTHATNTEPDTDKLLEAERLFWQSVKNSQAPQDLQTYLDVYPQVTTLRSPVTAWTGLPR